jgi:hypothetical protein
MGAGDFIVGTNHQLLTGAAAIQALDFIDGHRALLT